MKSYNENFYFDIAIHDYNEINFDKYFEGKRSLQEMAEEAYSSEHWGSLNNLTPRNLDIMIKQAEDEFIELEKEFDKTSLIRITVFIASIIHLAALITCGMVAIRTSEPILAGLFICLLALATLGIPITSKAARQIAEICRKMHEKGDIVEFLHYARKELKLTITPDKGP